MVEAGLEFIQSLKKKYDLTVVKFTAKMYIRKVYELQLDIIKFGLPEGADFSIQEDGLGNYRFSGTVTTEDQILRAKIKEMTNKEIFILRCDDENSLIFAEVTKAMLLNKEKKKFICYIKKLDKIVWDPPSDSPSHGSVKIVKDHYLALFVLFKKENGIMTEEDHVVRIFIL